MTVDAHSSGVSTTGGAPPHSYLRRVLTLHRVLVTRNVKAKYQETILGLAWTVISPLMMATVLVFMVQNMMGGGGRRFSSYIYIGVLVYGWFRGALSQATRSVVSNRMLARRPGFAPEVLPLVPVSNSLFDFVLSFPILAVLLLIGGSAVSPAFLLLPLVVGIQYASTAGLGYLMAAWHMRFRDVGHVVDLLLTIGFFLTPIFFRLEQVPDEYRWVFWLNPLVPLLEAYRQILIEGSWPDASLLLVSGSTAALFMVAGVLVYRSVLPKYVEAI